MKIQKRQWLLLFLVLSLPLILNSVAIWKEIGTTGILHLLNGTYQPANPNLPIASPLEIFLRLFLYLLFLGVLVWLTIFLSNRTFFQKQRFAVKLVEYLLMALFVAKVFQETTSFFMPLAWLPEFYDQIGTPVSVFVTNWSRWFLFPVTAMIQFIAIALFSKTNLEIKKQH